ncbi:MAG: sulfotransferase [Flavobacteriales bacterium]|nr:sulfotransferase [Flavobacteriales bacterium]
MGFNFILSKERSGSTLLAGILNNHPNVLGVIEETFSYYLFPKYGKKTLWSDEDIKSFYKDFLLMNKQSIGDYFIYQDRTLKSLLNIENRNIDYINMCKYLNLHFVKSTNTVQSIVDKQLEYLFFINDILAVFKRSKFIILVRDPRDNVEACIRRKLGKNLNFVYQSQIWNDYHLGILPFLNDSRFMIVKYEDLVNDESTVLKRICQHLDIEFCIDMIVNPNRFENVEIGASKNKFVTNQKSFQSNLNGPIDNSLIGRFNEVFTNQQIKKINYLTNNVANQLGYNIPVEKIQLTLTDRFQILRARIDKYYLMKIYNLIPVQIKLWLKKQGRSKK